MPRALLLALLLAPAASPPAAQPPKSPPKPLFTENFESGAIEQKPPDPGRRRRHHPPRPVRQGSPRQVRSAPSAPPPPAQRTHALPLARNLPEPLRHHLFGRAYVYITPTSPIAATVLIPAGATGFPTSSSTRSPPPTPTSRPPSPTRSTAAKTGTPAPTFPPRPLDPPRVGVQRPARPGGHLGRRRAGHATSFTYKAPPIPRPRRRLHRFAFGFLLRGAAPVPFDIYYDDIALDTHRLGPVK